MFDLYFQVIWTSDAGIHSISLKMKVRYWKQLKSTGGKCGKKTRSELCNWIIKKY